MPAKPIGFNRFALIALRGDRTRDEIATKSQCDPGFYGRVERGTRAPSMEVAQRIADALGCDIRALVPSAVVDEEVAA